MAVYTYQCPVCKKQVDINKPMSDASRPEKCPSGCDTCMERLWVPVDYSWKCGGAYGKTSK